MLNLDYSDAILLYYLFVAKIIPALVTFLADKYFHIKIRFKSLSLFNASVQNVSVKWAGYEIFVGEIGLKSKYLNKEYKKPLCVDVEDVRVSKISDEKHGNRNLGTSQDHFEVKHEVEKYDDVDNRLIDNSQKVKRYLLRILPPTIMMTLKYLEIRIKNFSTTILNRDKGPLATISIPNVELLFEGCLVRRRRTLFIALALQHIKSKFIAYNKQEPSRKPPQACLAEIIFDLTLETRVVRFERHLSFEKQHVSINNTQITFIGGLFDIIEHFMLHKRGSGGGVGIDVTKKDVSTVDSVSGSSSHREKLIERLTPNVLTIEVQQVEIKALNKQSSFHYHLLLQNADVKVKSKTEKSAKVRALNLRIYTPIHEVLHLKKVTLEGKIEGENLIKCSVNADTIEAVYNHEDIYGWFLKIFTAGMKSSRKEIIVKAIATMNRNAIEFYHSPLVQNLFNKIILTGALECQNIIVKFELDDKISSLSATRVKMVLNQSDKLRENSYADYTMDLLFKKRNWNADFITEGNLCWFMDAKYPQHADNKRTFIRGSALLLGDTFARVSSHRDCFKLSARVKSLHTEYSNKLTSFCVQSLKSFKSYDKLFKQLSNNSPPPPPSSINVREILMKFKVNVAAANISCFFINRHDICTLANLSNFTSLDTLNYQLDTIQVSSIDLAKSDCICDLSQSSTIYISTKQIKVNIDLRHENNNNHDDDGGSLPQLCVDFTEKLDCSWNAHFLRHQLSLVRDFRRFKQNVEDALEIVQEPKTLSSLRNALPVSLDIKKLRNVRIKHADMNVDKLILLINELSGENLFFYNYFH